MMYEKHESFVCYSLRRECHAEKNPCPNIPATIVPGCTVPTLSNPGIGVMGVNPENTGNGLGEVEDRSLLKSLRLTAGFWVPLFWPATFREEEMRDGYTGILERMRSSFIWFATRFSQCDIFWRVKSVKGVMSLKRELGG